jgi:hypothetical protein
MSVWHEWLYGCHTAKQGDESAAPHVHRPSSGDSILTAKTTKLIGPKSSSETPAQRTRDVSDGIASILACERCAQLRGPGSTVGFDANGTFPDIGA